MKVLNSNFGKILPTISRHYVRFLQVFDLKRPNPLMDLYKFY